MKITEITSYLYIAFCVFIPLYYLYKFCKHKTKRKKRYLKALIIAIMMFGILYSLKLVSKKIDLLNCYINNNCYIEKEEKEKQNSKTTTTSQTTTRTSSSSKITTTTETTTVKTTTNSGVKEYKTIEVPSGKTEDLGTTSNGFKIQKINGSYYIDGILMANKTYALADGYVPSNTYKSAEGVTSVCNTCINKVAYSAWLDMLADAKALGLNIWIQSGYRPYSSQVNIYNSYVKRDGKEKADTYSSRPGHSDHQTGLAFDLNSITDAFGNTEEGKWIDQNCYKYGFIIRFPKNKADYTGYKYESWHLRYVGFTLSNILYNNGEWLSLEEYFGITSVYED